MPPSTRDLLASVLGELPAEHPIAAPPGTAGTPPPHPSGHPGPWRVTAKLSGGQVQISNHRESRVVSRDQVELYLRGHGPEVPPRR
jgi:hypothetical protein